MQNDLFEDAMSPDGTFDLGASYGRPQVQHVGGRRMPAAMNGINEVAQAMEILGIGPDDSSGRYNLADLGNKRVNESIRSDYGLNFNLGASIDKNRNMTQDDQFLLASNSVRGLKKYAAIDHFKEEDPFKEKVPEEKVQEKAPEEKPQDIKAVSPIKISDSVAQTSPQKEKFVDPLPSFDSQLKEIREGYAKEYEQRMNQGFQELNELKKDFAQRQAVYDSKQVRELRREIKKLEDEVIDSSNQKAEVEKEVERLKTVISSKDAQLDKLLNGNQNQEGHNQTLRELVKEKNLQIEAMITKMDLMKKSLDDISIKYLDQQKLLEDMNSQDFAKQNLILKRQNAELIEDLALKQTYITDLKDNMKSALQRISSTQDHSQQTAIFSQLLENLSQENIKARRVVEELQKRENQCQRRWNKLLQENLDLQQKNNVHGLQLQRQREQYQQIIHQNERKLLESNQRMAWIQSQDEKRAAAEYLVEQMRICNEEKQSLIFDNQNISTQLNELQFEFDKMQREMKDFMPNQEFGVDSIAQNTQRLVQRIEELEDLVIELKSKQSAAEIVELKQLISQLELDAHSQEQKIAMLLQQRVNAKDLFQANEMHQSYLNIMKEREKVIEQLHNQIKKFGEAKIMNEPNNNPSFGQLSNYQRVDLQGGRTTSLGISAKAGSLMAGPTEPNFHDERVKDAMTFNNVMRSVHNSTGFLGGKEASVSLGHGSLGGGEISSAQLSNKNNMFQNFTKDEKDQWV